MSPWRRVVVLVSRLRGLFARRRLARDAQQEIEMHLDLLAAQYVRAGNPPAEARRLARAKFGGVTQLQESLRDQAGFPMLESIVRDVRYALRGLRRNPGFSLIVVLTLGVGIGANAAVFSFVNAVLLRPLPYAEADRLVAVQETSPPSPFFVTPGDYVDWKERNEVFETLSGYVYSLAGSRRPGPARYRPVAVGAHRRVAPRGADHRRSAGPGPGDSRPHPDAEPVPAGPRGTATGNPDGEKLPLAGGLRAGRTEGVCGAWNVSRPARPGRSTAVCRSARAARVPVPPDAGGPAPSS